MDREPAGVTDAEPRPAAARGHRRRRAVVVVVTVVLVAVVVVTAVLAARREVASDARPAATPTPTVTASRAVSAIYQRVRPSGVGIRAHAGAGSGGSVAEAARTGAASDATAGARRITVRFFDGATTSAAVVTADPKLDVAVLSPASLPEVVVPAALGGGADVGAPVVAVGNPLGLADSVSAGVVSGLNRTAQTADGTYSGLLPLDASVTPR